MIALHPDQLLHDLEEDPRRIPSEITVADVHHLVMEGSQGTQAVIGLPALQEVEQVDHRIGDAESLGGGHFLDAVGMQIGVEQILEFLPRGLPYEDILDHPKEFMIFAIKAKF
jgi:hypothetical protein